MIVFYKCDYCGGVYKNREDCMKCEMSHMPKDEKIKTQLIDDGEFVCNYCEHSYFVYGCEQDCDIVGCYHYNNWPKFKPVVPLHNKKAHGGV